MRRVTSIDVVLVECGGRAAVGIVEHQPDFGDVARRPLPEPAKITSSMPEARMFLYELSPITQRIASTRLDLPQPLGPTTPVKPGSILNSVGSQKLLNPASRSRSNFMDSLLSTPRSGAGPPGPGSP